MRKIDEFKGWNSDLSLIDVDMHDGMILHFRKQLTHPYTLTNLATVKLWTQLWSNIKNQLKYI